jgi:hypothetical protein
VPVFDIEDKADRGRLIDAIYQSERDLEIFLKPRDQCMALYRGQHWKKKRWRLQDRRPVPFMRTALDTYTQHLSSVRPQALVLTEELRLQSTADKLGIACNRLFDEIGFARSLRMFVKEALIGFPLMKISMSRVKTSRMHGWRHEAGQPFADVVYTRDVVADFSASSPDRMGFIGNRYRVPLEWVKKNAGRNELYRKKDVDLLTPLTRLPRDSKRPIRHVEPIYDQVELIDLYFPFDNRFATIPAPEHHAGDMVLMTEEWYGPEGGPYVWPSFAETQDEVLPVPPAWDWIDGDLAVNELYGKLIAQAKSMKTVLGVQGNAVRDGERLVRAEDGDVYRLDHPQGSVPFRFPGPDQPVLSFAIHLRSLLSHVAGNLDLMAGMQAQSGTATQDQLLFAQGSRRLQDLQQLVTGTVEQVMRRLMWYLFYDPGIDMPLTRRVDNVTVRGRLRHEDLRGDFLRYNFQIEPHSMRFKTPEERFGQLMGLMNQLVMPLAQLIQQQGNTIDINELLKIAADYTGLSELNRVIRRSDREIPQEQAGAGQPAVSSREYVRRGVSASQNPLEAINRLPGIGAGIGGNGRN